MAVTTASQQYTAELCTACAVCVCMVDFPTNCLQHFFHLGDYSNVRIVFCEGFWKGICSTTIIYFNYMKVCNHA